MPVTVEQTVDVEIKIQAAASSLGSFSVPLVMSSEARTLTSDPVLTFSGNTALQDMVTAGFSTTGRTYKIAQALMSGNVSTFKVGRSSSDWTHKVEVTPSPLANSSVYAFKIANLTGGGTTQITTTSDGSATVAEITLALTTAINLTTATTGVAAVDNSTHVTITANTANRAVAFTNPVRVLIKDATVSNSVTADYVALQASDSKFFYTLLDTPSSIDKAAIADQVEGEERIFVVDHQDTAIGTSASTDIASTFQTSARKQTVQVWCLDINECAAASLVGDRAGTHPMFGEPWAYSKPSITRDSLTTTQLTFATNKLCNVMVDMGGQNVLVNGCTTESNTSWVDLKTGTLALTIDLRGAGLNAILAKPPFSNFGMDLVTAELDRVLYQYQGGGTRKDMFLDPAVPAVSQHPDIKDITTTDKAARFLQGVTFGGDVNGRIQSLSIKGYFTL